MKILLIYPQYPQTYWSFHHALKFISKKASYPPLGLLTVAAMLPPHWEKRLVDLNITYLKDADIIWADYVFISAMVVQKDSVRKVIESCKNLKRPVVAGGPLFTTSFEDYSDVDHLVLNEGEITMPSFLNDLERGEARRIYTTEEWADITKTPIPQWDLIDMKKYATMNIQYSRGCPFDCDFCNITSLYGHRPRVKTSVQIINELDSIYKKGWRGGVLFVDDNFIGNKKHLKQELLPAISAWMDEHRHPFVFSTEASINLSDDDELMNMMVKAGFNVVFVGIETTDEKCLAECNKVQNTNRDMLASVRKMHSAGLQVQGGFIVGFDNDQPAVFDRLIRFIQESGIVTAMVGLLNAPKGTKLYQRLQKEGRISNDFTGNNTDYTMNFIPKMNQEILLEGYKTIVDTIYSPKYYYQRVRRFLKEFKPISRKIKIPEFNELKALARSIIILGIGMKGRTYYWRLFFWSLFRQPKMFPMAITMSIYGFHFRRVFEKG